MPPDNAVYVPYIFLILLINITISFVNQEPTVSSKEIPDTDTVSEEGSQNSTIGSLYINVEPNYNFSDLTNKKSENYLNEKNLVENKNKKKETLFFNSEEVHNFSKTQENKINQKFSQPVIDEYRMSMLIVIIVMTIFLSILSILWVFLVKRLRNIDAQKKRESESQSEEKQVLNAE